MTERFIENVVTSSQITRNNKDSIDYAVNNYGCNLEISETIRSEVLCALSFYPELKQTRIRYKYKSIRGTMNARPSLLNLFSNRLNRRYMIIINNNKGRNKGLCYDSLASDVKVGWFGHEMAHLSTYKQMSNFQTLIFSFLYVTSEKFITRVERFTDYVAINHGLAFQIYKGDNFLLNCSSVSEKYKERIRTRFLSLEEIICVWYSILDKSIELK
jgi:hypothetical protein